MASESGKSKKATGVLGIHNFYLGYNGRGIAQMLISVLSRSMLSLFPGFGA